MKTMITDDSVASLAKKTGGSKSQMTKLLVLALPLIIKALTKNASSQSGASSLLGALTQHNNTNTIASQIANANQQDGSAILGHIFGNNMSSVTNGLAQQTGLTGTQVNTGLSSLAPAVLSGLSAATNATSGNSGAVDLTSLLNTFAGQQTQQNTTTSLLSSLMGGGQTQQQSSGGLLSSLFGGGQTQQQQSSALNPVSLLSSMMGGNTSSANTTSSLLGSLLGRSTEAGLSNILDDDDDDEDNFNGTALLNTLMNLKG